MPLPDDFIFSQSSLQDYVDCPRRFKLKYILRQRWPAAEVDNMLTFEHRMEQGQLFHHHLIGILAGLLTKRLDDLDVKRKMSIFIRRFPHLSMTALWRFAKLLMLKVTVLDLGDEG